MSKVEARAAGSEIQPQVGMKGAILALYGSFYLSGVTTTVYGPTVSYFMQDYNISIGQAGLFVTFMAMGRLFSVLFSGILTDRWGRKPVLTAGAACLAVSLIGIGSVFWYSAALVFAIIAGIGHGMVGTSANAAVSDMSRAGLSGALNRLHMIFSIGCLIGPLITGIILASSFHWRTVYYFNGILGLVITLWLATRTFPKLVITGIKKEAKQSLTRSQIFNMSGYLLLISFIPFIYSGAGNSINTWINKYMGDVVNFSVLFASGSLAIYNLGLVLGRLVSSVVSDKIGTGRAILYGSVGSLIAVLMVLLSGWAPVILLGLWLTGFCFAGLFPTAIAIVSRIHPEKTGTVSGLMVMMASLGSMTIPAAIGGAAEIWGLANGMRVLILFVVVLAIVALMLRKVIRKPEF